MAAEPKVRLDLHVSAAGLAPSRQRAQALIMARRVRIDGQVADKPGMRVPPGAVVTVDEPEHPYVGRGGIKLAGALDHFGLNVAELTCLDLGSSTGGFTDCLLQRGARFVVAVDVGRGLIAWKLREDPRVLLLEGINARKLHRADLKHEVTLLTADLAFISLRLVMPKIRELLTEPGDALVLVKPQFELGRGEVGRGIVRDPAKHAAAVQMVAECARENGLAVRGVTASPIKGAKGNREFFLWLSTAGADLDDRLQGEITEATAQTGDELKS